MFMNKHWHNAFTNETSMLRHIKYTYVLIISSSVTMQFNRRRKKNK